MKFHVRHLLAFVLATTAGVALATQAITPTDPLSSWNDGAAKTAIVDFVPTTTDTQSLYGESQKQGWVVISMKKDWNRIFAFESVSQQ